MLISPVQAENLRQTACSGYMSHACGMSILVRALQARDSHLKGQWQSRLPAAQSQQAFYDDLRASNDIEMSLMVRASRNLPLMLLTKEYSHILKRR